MAYRGNNSSGSGCFPAVIAFLVLFYLPAYVFGDDFGWDVLIAWWMILAFIALVIYAVSSESTGSTNQSLPTYSSISKSTETTTENEIEKPLKVKRTQLNRAVMDNYNSKLAFRAKLEQEIECIQTEQRRLNDEVNYIVKEQVEIRNYTGKPFFMSKKKYLKQRQPDLERMDSEIESKVSEQNTNEEKIRAKEREKEKIKYNILDESNPAFERLKKAIEQFKKSCSIGESPDIRNCTVSTIQRDSDLKNVTYKTQPYGMKLKNYRFYIFPNGIWVFEGDGKLAGVYKPKALSGYSESKRQAYVWDNWDRKYDVKYSMNLSLCGCDFKYDNNSYDDCELLEKAISLFSEVKESKDIIPVLLELLDRCSAGDDVKTIREHIEDYEWRKNG